MIDAQQRAELHRLYERYGIDDSASRSPYVAALESEIAALDLNEGESSDAFAALRAAEIVLLGEFHPLSTACDTAVDLLRDSIDRGAPAPWVGLEMIHARDQLALDAYLAGTIGERELFRRIRYREEWGYPTAGPRRLLRFARAHGVLVRGLDVPPRGSASDLALRDRVAAERIEAELARGAGRVIAIYGEAHVARPHLPSAVAARVPNARQVRVFHDLEHLPRGRGRWLAAGSDTFARQRAPWGARLKSLAKVFDGWASEAPPREALDVSLLAHELIDGLASLVELDPRQHSIAPGRFLADVYPEVFGAAEARRARRRIGESVSRGRTSWRAALAGGVHYDDAGNLLLVAEPAMPAFAIACGRFLCRALAAHSEWPARPPAPRSPLARTADLAFGAALASVFDPSAALWNDRADDAPDGLDDLAARLDAKPDRWAREGRRLGCRLAAAVAGGRIPPVALREPLLAAPETGERAGELRLDWLFAQRLG